MPGIALIDDMGVANVGFLLENLAKEAGPLQYLRELVQNALEAILRKRVVDDGRVEIDFEEIAGVKKLRITDNGIGMTPDEVQENLNRLSASGGTQAFDKNFGIGAKITAAVRNPHGVMYKAWKDGVGSVTILGHHQGRYGRIGARNPDDGSVDYWLPLPGSDKHPIIKDSGVSVVLLGKSRQDDTTLAPRGVEFPSQWVAAFLERRYYELPPGITVRVLRPSEIYDSGIHAMRPIHHIIRGQHYYLDKHSDCSGVVRLRRSEANVLWWLLSEPETGGQAWNNRGHVAALYQGELYHVRGGTERTSALKDFGIYAGFGRVVIYVEPTNVIGANAARSSLVLKGNVPVDYAGIGAAFADEMPEQLAGFMAGQVSSDHADNRKSILKNLKEVEAALEQARFKRSNAGKLVRVEPELIGRTTQTERPREARPPEPGPPPDTDAIERVGSDYLRRAHEEMNRLRAKRIDADPIPRIVWDEEGSTVPPGRAATYTHTSHVVTANARFSFYADLLEWSVEEARRRMTSEVGDDTLRKICTLEVRRWFEQALAEAVVVLRPLSHDERWGPEVFRTGLSDEGLTAAVVSHRWFLLTAIKRDLAGRLGSVREKLAS
ncbi:hypothetical protein HF313_18365 [Massilia atriviolacea]|uniref:Histidine kinase/HSP90-like ATPase domain-containing protein n=1 Tax=Massilia atriviolacea TaxID=2495579 RepID=A0A430HTC8_9BURK|nr:ATP-binding protein [Massilia atriviolacea]RSZ60752.1 hypothetical protein EJB06_01025 [Massilia atriviolacea]